jgi:hypothetical protein
LDNEEIFLMVVRCSPHQITFHIESKTFAVVTSIAEPSNKVRRKGSSRKRNNAGKYRLGFQLTICGQNIKCDRNERKGKE